MWSLGDFLKFRFKLESILRYRRTLEEQARANYLQARAKADQALLEIEQMYQAIDDARLSIKNAALQGSSANHLGLQEDFIQGQKIRIDAARMKARELLSTADEKQEELTQAQRERKVLELLKDRKHADFKITQKKLDMKIMDEVGSRIGGNK